MELRQTVSALLGLLATVSAHAGNATAKVGQVAVGREGNQVFIELLTSQFNSFPCSTTHPSGFRYAFLLSTPGAKEMLATVLAAQTSGQGLQVVGLGTCSISANMEDVAYVVLRP